MPSKTASLHITEFTCDLCGAKVSMQHKEPDNPDLPHEWAVLAINGKLVRGVPDDARLYAYLCGICAERVKDGKMYDRGLQKSLRFSEYGGSQVEAPDA